MTRGRLSASKVFAGRNWGKTPAFADGSYSVVTWSLIFALVGGLAIDLFIGRGHDKAFLGGVALGVAVIVAIVFPDMWAEFTYSPKSLGELNRPRVKSPPNDISLFWLTSVFGVIAYAVSALIKRRRRN